MRVYDFSVPPYHVLAHDRLNLQHILRLVCFHRVERYNQRFFLYRSGSCCRLIDVSNNYILANNANVVLVRGISDVIEAWLARSMDTISVISLFSITSVLSYTCNILKKPFPRGFSSVIQFKKKVFIFIDSYLTEYRYGSYGKHSYTLRCGLRLPPTLFRHHTLFTGQ